MPPPLPAHPSRLAGERLASVALHVARWAERSLGEHDPPLTVAQFLALESLQSGVTAPGELARRAGVSEAAVSQLIRDLERAGLVDRRLSTSDRRRHELRLSTLGETTYASAAALVAERIGHLLGGLPGPDARRLADLLGLVGSAVGATAPPRRPPPPPRPPRL